MSFLDNTIRFISREKSHHRNADSTIDECKAPLPDPESATKQSLNFEFSIPNYNKKSFSELVLRPLSNYMEKALRSASFVITGLMFGSVIAVAAVLGFVIFMQFGTFENSLLSALIVSRFEKFLPDSDLAIRSASIQWNSEHKTFDINLKRVRIDDMTFPKISITPNYLASLREHRLVAKSVSIINPKIQLRIADNLKTISFYPNMEKGGKHQSLLEPLSSITELKCILDDNVIIKCENADVSILENNINWDLKNVYCEHKLGNNFPNAIDFSAVVPGQKYFSRISVHRIINRLSSNSYDIKLESINPAAISKIIARRSTPIDGWPYVMDGYNLPISGNIYLGFDGQKLLGGKFDLVASSGSIKLPVKNAFSLSLGKRIDNGNVSGSFINNKLTIDSININYGNSGLQLSGIEIPLSNYKPLDIANLTGTLSLTNIDISEIDAILPENISKTIRPVFSEYLPDFKLTSFKVDMNGPVSFGDRISNEKLTMNNGVFSIQNAQIPTGEQVISDISATGTLKSDGIDVKLSHAKLGKTNINNGVFFISSQDGSWIGKVNADIPLKEVSTYVRDISPRLTDLRLGSLPLSDKANINLKIVRIAGDESDGKSLPFRIVEGDGVIRADQNSKDLKIAWDDHNLHLSGNIYSGNSKIFLQVDDNFTNNEGTGTYAFSGASDFLKSFIPDLQNCLGGDFNLQISNHWKKDKEEFDVTLDLNNATMTLPGIGSVKTKKENGTFTAHILKKDNILKFSKVSLQAGNNQFTGQLTANTDGKVIKCSLDKCHLAGCNAKINLIQKDSSHYLFSAVGDSLDIRKIFDVTDKIDKSIHVSAYVNVNELIISNHARAHKAKGSLDLLGSRIIGGTGIAIVGKDTTVALNAEDTNDVNYNRISLSASNAGEFLRYLQITDTIQGGSINFVIKSPKAEYAAAQNIFGSFEMDDFIVHDNTNITKLVSLSSVNWLPGAGDFSIGFNSFTGNFILTKDQIKLENFRAYGPTIAVSLNGSYDRINDDITAFGLAVSPQLLYGSSNINSMSRTILTADYELNGSILRPSMSVKPVKPRRVSDLIGLFSDILPSIANTATAQDVDDDDTSSTEPAHTNVSENATNSYDDNAFDNDVEGNGGEGNILVREHAIKNGGKKNNFTSRRPRSFHNIGSNDRNAKKFGVTINRGAPKKG
jgi:hypothetical protein